MAAAVQLRIRGVSQPDWRAVVGALHDADIGSPRRSTIPLVVYWDHPLARLAPLLRGLGFPETDPVIFSFEHPVPVARGRGKASVTDLMILASSMAIAIEGKYTEPPYPQVKDWLRGATDQNRHEVLHGWLDMLAAATSCPLTIGSVGHLRYQLIHRAASACSPKAKNRAVIYQLFDAARADDCLKDLRALRAIVPAPELKLGVLITPVTIAGRYLKLLNDWDASHRNMATDVRSSLLDASDLSFADCSLVLV